jgi:hypothetical protein
MVMTEVEEVLMGLIVEAECQMMPDMPALIKWLRERGYKIVPADIHEYCTFPNCGDDS